MVLANKLKALAAANQTREASNLPELDHGSTDTAADSTISPESQESDEQEHSTGSQSMIANNEVRENIVSKGIKDKTNCTLKVRDCDCSCACRSLEPKIEGVKLDMVILESRMSTIDSKNMLESELNRSGMPNSFKYCSNRHDTTPKQPTTNGTTFAETQVQFCDFFNQKRVVVNFLILFTHNVFIPRHREINKGPPPSHPIQHGNVWTIIFQFPSCFDIPIPPDLDLPILRHSNLILNLLVPYISRLYTIFSTQLPVYSQTHAVMPPTILPLRANPLQPLARCPTDSTSFPQTLHFGSTFSRSIVARNNLVRSACY